MDKDFDFDRIGKRMPYETPEGFFDEMEANVWQEVQRTSFAFAKRKPHHRLRIVAGALAVAASVALVLVLRPHVFGEPADGLAKVEQAFADLCREDQAYLLDVYQEDIFMNE